MESFISLGFGFAFLHLYVLVHEFGHYAAVRRCNIRPYTFSAGSGPLLVNFVYNKTNVSIRAFPFGGKVTYKRIVTYRQSIFISAAGPLANLLLAGATWIVYSNAQISFFFWATAGSLIGAVINLIPFEGSDGFNILKQWKEMNHKTT